MATSNVARADDQPAWAKGLKDNEFIFVSAYLVDFNATKAALVAGSPKRSAHARAYEIKHRPHVRAAIDMAMKERLPSLKMTLAERLAGIVTTDLADVAKWGERKVTYKDLGGKGKARTYTQTELKVLASKHLTPAQRGAIKSVKRRVGLYGDSLEVVMHDPMAAAEKLADLFGLRHNPDALGGGGGVTLIIEGADGSRITASTQGAAPMKTIDHDDIARHIAENAEPGPEDVPPGTAPAARLLIVG